MKIPTTKPKSEPAAQREKKTEGSSQENTGRNTGRNKQGGTPHPLRRRSGAVLAEDARPAAPSHPDVVARPPVAALLDERCWGGLVNVRHEEWTSQQAIQISRRPINLS